jgi:uncharacterized membrane protein YeaQ/YmgE (transglycosylase-associated protein family)
MGLVAWLVLGAIAGYLAGMFVKGDERMGVLGHVFLGIVGALVGGFIANQLTNGNYMTGIDIPSIIVAVIGAILVVVAYKTLTGRRQI